MGLSERVTTTGSNLAFCQCLIPIFPSRLLSVLANSLVLSVCFFTIFIVAARCQLLFQCLQSTDSMTGSLRPRISISNLLLYGLKRKCLIVEKPLSSNAIRATSSNSFQSRNLQTCSTSAPFCKAITARFTRCAGDVVTLWFKMDKYPSPARFDTNCFMIFIDTIESSDISIGFVGSFEESLMIERIGLHNFPTECFRLKFVNR